MLTTVLYSITELFIETSSNRTYRAWGEHSAADEAVAALKSMFRAALWSRSSDRLHLLQLKVRIAKDSFFGDF